MDSIDKLATFFGWCSVINIAVLMLTSLMLTLFKGFISRLHSRLMGVNENNLSIVYFQYLGNYKIAIFMFNLVPYLALCCMR